jgi:hypothetical protein
MLSVPSLNKAEPHAGGLLAMHASAALTALMALALAGGRASTAA